MAAGTQPYTLNPIGNAQTPPTQQANYTKPMPIGGGTIGAGDQGRSIRGTGWGDNSGGNGWAGHGGSTLTQIQNQPPTSAQAPNQNNQLNSALQQAPGGQWGNIGQTQYAPNTPNNQNSAMATIGSGNIQSNLPQSSAAQNRSQWNTNYDPVDTGVDNFRQFGDQYYQHSMDRMQPQLQQQEQAARQSLVDRGLQPGTEAYNAEMQRLDNSRNDMMSATALGAEQLGLQAQNQYFGQESANNQFGLNQAQQNYSQGFGYDQLANALQQAQIGANASIASSGAAANASMHNAGLANQLGYSQLNEQGRQFDVGNIFNTQGQNQNFMLGLLGANNAAQNTAINQFQSQQGANNNWWNQISGATSNAPGVSFTPNTGYTNSQIQGNQNYMNAIGADTSAATGLLGGAMMMSDERVKENVEYVETVDGVNVYDFDYIDKSNGEGRYRGVMAQEVIETHPESVIDIAGIYHVDYNQLPVDMVRL